MIYVIIPVHNRLKFTINCLSSLKRQNNYKKLNIIIIDDASTDDTNEYLKKNFPEVIVLNGTGSLFWCGAVYFGIEYIMKICAPSDWVLLVNNDIELSPDAISNLVSISEIKARKTLVGALAVSSDDRKTIIKSGTVVESWFLNKTKHLHKGLQLDEITNKDPVEVDFLTGRCLLHPVEMFSVAGNYDAKTFVHYGGDDEFSMRVKKFGYSTLLCPSSIVFLKSNEITKSAETSMKKFFFTFFSIRSSSNIFNKFNLAIKVVPFYAKISFFIIGFLKSLFIFLKNE
jgi:GT2 family glycosyltransferase